MTDTAVASLSIPRVRWTWLQSRRSDIVWNFAPFWAGLAMIAVLYAARDLGGFEDNPAWNFTLGGRSIHVASLMFYFYGPIIDAPHLWATIARTYADRDEWASRRRLLLTSLLWLLVGPVVILLPYALSALSLLPRDSVLWGWVVWSNFVTFYALFHIYKQHWGFISLYKRKNQDLTDPLENRADQLFFYVATWAPFAAMLTAPWYRDYDGKPFGFSAVAGERLHMLSHATFFLSCAAYAVFQLKQWRDGVPRNGPKLAYLATVMPLNYFAFSIHPLVTAFWVITIGTGHCAQYHRVVWTYGQSKYAGKAGVERKLPSAIFENIGLYLVLAVVFGVLSLQGFGSSNAKQALATALGEGLLVQFFGYLDRHASLELALRVVAGLVTGVRLHHFYVDSKIWRIGKTQGLEKALQVAG